MPVITQCWSNLSEVLRGVLLYSPVLHVYSPVHVNIALVLGGLRLYYCIGQWPLDLMPLWLSFYIVAHFRFL